MTGLSVLCSRQSRTLKQCCYQVSLSWYLLYIRWGSRCLKGNGRFQGFFPKPLRHMDSHLIHECLSRSHSPPQTTARSVHALSQRSPHCLKWMPHIYPQNCPFAFNDLQPHLIYPSLDQPYSPTQTESGSSQLFFHNFRQTNRPTDRWDRQQVCSDTHLRSVDCIAMQLMILKRFVMRRNIAKLLQDESDTSSIIFGRPYYRSSLWYSISSVCRLSSVCLSVTFCIVAKRYVLAKKCLKE